MEQSNLFPTQSRELLNKKNALAPKITDTWRAFSKAVFEEGALPGKTKQLIAVAVAHVTQCPYCIRSHTRQAIKNGATHAEIMEAIWVASEMRAGAAYAHGTIAIDEMEIAQSPG